MLRGAARAELQFDLAGPEPLARLKAEAGRRKVALLNGLRLQAETLPSLKAEEVLDLARALVRSPRASLAGARHFAEGDLKAAFAAEPAQITLCGTERLAALYALAEAVPGYADPAILRRSIHRIVAFSDLEGQFATTTHSTANFTITYFTDGPAAPAPDFGDFDVLEPGVSPPRVLERLPASTVPAYVRLVAFWLERSLQLYIGQPFSMRNPAASRRLSAYINTEDFGSANGQAFYINNALPPDVVCAVAVHELFHMVQFEYPGAGPWRAALLEGGATFAEDTVADKMNRYLDEAGRNFNGIGLLANPNQSLFDGIARYKTSLFWRYLAEQRSDLDREPVIGVDAYRRIMEECSAGGYTLDSVTRAIRALPWDTEFYEFSRSFEGDLLSSETSFGNFAAACYLKDFPSIATADRRFGFLENGENIHIDDAIREVVPDAPATETLVKVTVQQGRLTPGGPLAAFQGTVQSLASRFYEVEIDREVESIEVTFTAGGSLSSLIFQLLLIDDQGELRNIIRSDRREFRRTLASASSGQRLSRVVVVVSGADSSGSFQVSLRPVEAAPDVMITNWNCLPGKEYHMDSRGWAWTWVSPDLWFEMNDSGGHTVHVRLRNQGNAPAEGVACSLQYRAVSGGVETGPWLPVLDASGILQGISGERLVPDESRTWSFSWLPRPEASTETFTLRARVTAANDANTDNKQALSRLSIRAEGDDPGPRRLPSDPQMEKDEDEIDIVSPARGEGRVHAFVPSAGVRFHDRTGQASPALPESLQGYSAHTIRHYSSGLRLRTASTTLISLD